MPLKRGSSLTELGGISGLAVVCAVGSELFRSGEFFCATAGEGDKRKMRSAKNNLRQSNTGHHGLFSPREVREPLILILNRHRRKEMTWVSLC